MAKRFTSSAKWNDTWFYSLEAKYKLLWFYMLDTCDCAGVWEANIRKASADIGLEYSAEECLEVLGEKIQVVGDGKWWLKNFIRWQYGCEVSELHPSSAPHRGVIKSLNQHRIINQCEESLNPSVTLSEPLAKEWVTCKDKDKDKDKDKKRKDGGLGEGNQTRDETIDAAALRCWGREGHLSKFKMDELVNLSRKHGRDKVISAIEESALHNVAKIKYVSAILSGNGKKKNGSPPGQPPIGPDGITETQRFLQAQAAK